MILFKCERQKERFKTILLISKVVAKERSGSKHREKRYIGRETLKSRLCIHSVYPVFGRPKVILYLNGLNEKKVVCIKFDLDSPTVSGSIMRGSSRIHIYVRNQTC